MTRKTATLKLALAAALATVATFAFASSASAALPPWEITSFDGGTFKATPNLVAPDPANQAGEHPMTGWTKFERTIGSGGADEKLQDVIVDLPPGLVGSLTAVPACPATQKERTCPISSQVGVVHLLSNGWYPVFRIEAPDGVLAAFKFEVAGISVYVTAKLRTGDDYGVHITSLNAPTNVSDSAVKFILWGVPADPAWDAVRGDQCLNDSPFVGGPGENPQPKGSPPPGCPASIPGPRKPFLTLPTSCVGPIDTFLQLSSRLGSSDTASFTSHDNALPTPNPLGIEGCNAVPFAPTLEARPTTNVADSPSGLDVKLHIPQNEDPDGIATAHLRDSVVTLPEGMTVNPSSANGLGACNEAQFGFTGMEGDVVHTTEGPATCPEDSKLGTVQVETPVLDHPLDGAVYLAAPHANPFDSLLALYIAVDDPETGIVAKLAGEVRTDPVTGQLTASFKENPQLPFEDLNLHFFGGAGGSLRTPVICGTYSTTSSLTPWSAPDSGPPATPSDSWAIEQGPGGSCANDVGQLPNSPSFDAGTISPIAAAKSPLVVNLRREDGSQQFSALSLSAPPGLVGKLAGIPSCPDSALAAAAAKSGRDEEASSTCPAASYVGSVTAGAGAGPAPYYATGKAYLTGPYKGAPLSLAIVTPATAGPFDLGTIVVRTALYVDSKTAQITAVSDPIPSILQGIPLDVRSVQVKMDRPDFTLNPTSCEPMSFGGALLSTLGNSVALQSRFQVGECGRLLFKPRLSLRLKGATKRNGYPALTATLEPRAGDANLASISVALPHSEFLAQEHIRTVCTRVQFAADACPPAAIYGTATVTTPLLDYPLTGPVYLRSSDNPLPDLVPDLRGPANQPIRLESAGRTDSIRGGIRNTFDFVPDAPFTKLVLRMQGGKKGLLVNSRDVCKRRNRATVKFSGHNGRTFEARPVLKAQCPKAAKHRSKHRAVRHSAR
jgi:hypothetical protein